MAADKTKKIKVAIVENNLVIGGVQKLVIDQLRTLSRELFEIHLITLHQPDIEHFYTLVPDDVRLVKLDFASAKDIKSWFRLYRTLRDIKPDIVKSSMYFSNTVVRILKPFFAYKVITAEHNTNDGKGRLQKLLNRFLHTLSVTTIVDSEMVADHLSKIEKVPRSQYTVIHNGVDLEAIEASKREFLPQRSALRAVYGIGDEDKLFLSIGRMVRQKNHERMIRAFSLLLKKRPNSKLMIIGDGGLKPQLEKLVTELGIKDQVFLLPAIKDIHKFYVMSDITLLSSDHEGFCIAAMEGLAFGAPLVSPRVAGVVEYLRDGENGLFAEKTPESLAEKMEEILTFSKEKFAEFQSEAQKTADNYSVEKYGERIAKLFIESTER
jgi:glycosyltransferase involved in cell wall biosynthesis